MKTTQREKLSLLFIGCLLILFFPILARVLSGSGFPHGGEPYYNMRIAEQIKTDGIISEDWLQQENYSFNLVHYLIAALSFLLPVMILAIILPPLFGMITVYFIFLLLEKLKVSFYKGYFLLLFIVLSPLFVFLFSVLSKYTLIICFSTIIIYALFARKEYLAYILLPLVMLTDFFSACIVLLIILLLSVKYKRLQKGFIILIPVLAITILISMILLNFSINISNPDLRFFISDLGASTGFSVFIVLLFFIGLVLNWRRDTKQVFDNLAALGGVALSIFILPVRFFFLFFLCLYASMGFNYLIRRKWSLNMLKKITSLVLFCGILFSVIVFIKFEIESQPSEEMLSALSFLQDKPSGTVLSHPSYGTLIQYFAEKRILFSASLDYSTTLYNQSSPYFFSRDLEVVETLFQQSNIKYIFIHEDMKEGLLWQEPLEGLLFLLKSSKKFINIYSYQGYEIWEYTGGTE